MPVFKVGVVIGKFQPVLQGQIEHVFEPAIKNSNLVIVLIGSSYRAPDCLHPFTGQERKKLIGFALDPYCSWRVWGEFGDATRPDITFGEAELHKTQIKFDYLRDFLYADTSVDWITQVQTKVNSLISKHVPNKVDVEITLYGAEDPNRPETIKQYHDWFPQWNHSIVKVPIADCSEKIIRSVLESDVLGDVWKKDAFNFKKELTPSVYHYLQNMNQSLWTKSIDPNDRPHWAEPLRLELIYLNNYWQRTQTGKYPIIFQTVDNVCYYKGNILLVRRKSQPGAGLWALPGGFLNAEESCRDGAMRELLEETGLRVRPEWFISRDTFDHPKRSIRGRTITNAFLWKIPDTRQVPQITAGSDAAKAKWFPLATVIEQMPEQIFEDHLDIILTLTKRL